MSSSSNSGVPSNNEVPSVFDNYARGIRGNVVVGTSDAIDVISQCDSMIKTTTVLSYIISVLVILLLIGVAFSFNYTFLLILVGIVAIISIYQSIILSNKDCNSMFDN